MVSVLVSGRGLHSSIIVRDCALVQALPAGQHTIKLAIGDELDNLLDTAVFIEGNAVIVPVNDFSDDILDDDVSASVLSDPHIQGEAEAPGLAWRARERERCNAYIYTYVYTIALACPSQASTTSTLSSRAKSAASTPLSPRQGCR